MLMVLMLLMLRTHTHTHTLMFTSRAPAQDPAHTGPGLGSGGVVPVQWAEVRNRRALLHRGRVHHARRGARTRYRRRHQMTSENASLTVSFFRLMSVSPREPHPGAAHHPRAPRASGVLLQLSIKPAAANHTREGGATEEPRERERRNERKKDDSQCF